MTLPDLKPHYSLFLDAAPERLHFAAHSHHYWPDVTFHAQQQAWLDAARLADGKWGHVFSTVVPAVQRGIADILSLPDPATICFAPNTHEFVLRLLSCCPAGRPARILTTDSEFYSFHRQISRLAEDGLVTVTTVPALPFDSFVERFSAAARQGGHDLVFLSHVFFNSGFTADPLPEIVAAIETRDTLVVIDGYHGFMAVPTNLAAVADRAFYIGGGYKYAMAGEGACFMHCPPGYGPRPRNTGWFADVQHLDNAGPSLTCYAQDAARFSGATFDPSGLYRLRAALDWLRLQGIGVADIHNHAHALQEMFCEGVLKLGMAEISTENLVVPLAEPRRGNFLTFRTGKAAEICAELKKRHVITDSRADRLRFGFGPYHAVADVDRLLTVLGKLRDGQ